MGSAYDTRQRSVEPQRHLRGRESVADGGAACCERERVLRSSKGLADSGAVCGERERILGLDVGGARYASFSDGRGGARGKRWRGRTQSHLRSSESVANGGAACCGGERALRRSRGTANGALAVCCERRRALELGVGGARHALFSDGRCQ